MTMTVGKWRRRALTVALATATSLGVMSTAAAMDGSRVSQIAHLHQELFKVCR